MLEELKQEVCRANQRIIAQGLAFDTWGNVSGIDRAKGLMAIKPSGVPYDRLKPGLMVVVSLETAEVIEGRLRPSSDTPTHLELYRRFTRIGGVVHTHSLFATAWAQARREIPPLGTTHADYFHGPVPCTRLMVKAEIERDYEINVGRVIVERFRRIDPMHVPAILVAGHGPFAWGPTAAEAVHCAIVLEHVARLAGETLRIDPDAKPIPRALLDKHFLRKHGPGAYYGQK